MFGSWNCEVRVCVGEQEDEAIYVVLFCFCIFWGGGYITWAI